MAGYIGKGVAGLASVSERKKVFTATSGQTAFTPPDGYTVNNVDVFQNGIRLVDGTDYTATDGTTVTLTNGAQVDDEVVIVAKGSYQNSDSYTKAEADAKFIEGDDTLYVDETNNRVGINKTDPAFDLDVAGDIAVSGGVYLGGTGSANHLDDYEEGTWTPTLIGHTSNPTVTYHASTAGGYTKVGNLVNVWGRVKLSSLSGGSGYGFIGGLPFTPSMDSYSTGAIGYSHNFATDQHPRGLLVNLTSAYLELYHSSTSDSRDPVNTVVNVSDWASTSDIIFNAIYSTS